VSKSVSSTKTQLLITLYKVQPSNTTSNINLTSSKPKHVSSIISSINLCLFQLAFDRSPPPFFHLSVQKNKNLLFFLFIQQQTSTSGDLS
jgi:hypothetical protein